MRRTVIFLFAASILILFLSFVYAAPITNDLHVNIQTTDSGGNVIIGTFDFVFNISTSSDCAVANVLYTNSKTLSTDSRGIISYYLPNVTLSYDEQYWLCYYRNGSLIEAIRMTRMPYAFRAQNVTLSGVEVDKSLNMGSYNFTTLGRVGIGTTSPSQKLDVAGAIQLSDNAGSNEAGTIRWTGTEFQAYNGTDWNTFGTTGGGASLWSQNESDIYYNNGNVGIGTDSPAYNLDIFKSSTATSGVESVTNAFLEINPSSDSTASYYANWAKINVITNNYLNNWVIPWFSEATQSGNGTMEYLVGSWSRAIHAGTKNISDVYGIVGQVKNTGNGTINLSAIGVLSSVRNDGTGIIDRGYGFWATARRGGGTFNNYTAFYMPTAVGTIGNIYGVYIEDANAKNYFAGNVGIGTTSPAEKLHVDAGAENIAAKFNSSAGITALDIDNTAADGDPALRFLLSGTSKWVVGVDDGDADKFRIGTGSLISSAPKLTIDSTGNVGIGTTSPGAKLDVNGSVKMVDGNQGANKVLTSDASGVGSWQTVAAVPSGAILMFNSSCPTGYTRVTALDDKFPRGSATYGSTGGSDNAVVVSHSHTFTGDTLGTHSHTFTGSALATHTHTFTGSSTTTGAGSSHTHAFTGTAMGTHGHADTFGFSGSSTTTGIQSASHTHDTVMGSHTHQLHVTEKGESGGSARITTAVSPRSGYVVATDLGTKTSETQSASHTHTLTPLGSITGSVTAASAGTPAGSNAAEASHTHTLTPLGTNTAVTAGTPAGSINSVSAGTPSGTVSTTGSSGTGANVPAYVTVVFCMKN